MFLIGLPMLQSCDDDGNSLGDWVQRMATVRVLGGDSFYLETDNGQKLWIGAPINLSYQYRPVEGQRVIINYTPLWEGDGDYDYTIKLNRIRNVLTKTIEDLTAANEEAIGDDKTNILDIWVGGNYLNVVFDYYAPRNKPHRVSLVRNTLVEPEEDGYIHLEYRYNDEDDVTNVLYLGRVSFYLGDYAPSLAAGTYKGIKIRVNDRNDGVKTLTYNFSNDNDDKEVATTDEQEKEDTYE